MIDLCPSSGRRVDSDSMVRCVCGCFWYGPDYPETDGHKRKVVDEVPWHNIKGHVLDREKWEKKVAKFVQVQRQIEFGKVKKKVQAEMESRYVTSALYTKKRGVTITK